MTASAVPFTPVPDSARDFASGPPERLSVGVIVDLVWGPWAGGHVKCWERIAAAAAAIPRELDVTVHYLGEKSGSVELADNVRFQLHRPVINTKWLGFTDNRQNHTCLAPHHTGLAQALARHDYERFAPDIARAYRRLGLPAHVDAEEVARRELRWWVVRREIGLAAGVAAGDAITRLYAAIYEGKGIANTLLRTLNDTNQALLPELARLQTEVARSQMMRQSQVGNKVKPIDIEGLPEL